MRKIIFLIIIFVAIALRFWQLGNVPPSPDWDEAALGYNAYSIMKTGHDEYGAFLPVILRSFDDYKPGLYAYLIIPFIKFIDLNLTTVRLPSAIFGVLAVIGVYFLVKELFPNAKKFNVLGLELSLAEACMFLFAISPWHIQFSRIAFEAQVGLSFNIFTLLFFVKGLRKGYYLILAAMFSAISIYVYQSEKVYLPILLLALIAIYLKDLLKVPKKWISAAILTGFLLILPVVVSISSDPNSLMRAKGVSVFSDQTQFLARNAAKIASDVNNKDVIGMITDNRRVEYAKAVISGYISHFNPNWLFITGDIQRHHAPDMGLLYLFELPLLLIGIYLLVFGSYPKKAKLTIFAIFLIAPIPASVTSGVPHAVRTINFLPTFQIFIAIGFIELVDWAKRLKYGKFIIATYLLLALFNFSYFLNQYFVQQNYYYSEYWQYGWKQALNYVEPIKNKYKKIVVSNDRPLDQSYIFALFYLKYDPSKYLKTGGSKTGGFKEPHSFDKYEFRPIEWNKEESGNLYLGRPEDFPGGVAVLKTINYLNGKHAILIVAK